MRHTPPADLDRAFVLSGTPSFADLLQRLTDDEDLDPTRRRDMSSGLRRVATALGLPLDHVPADARWLQPRIARIAPAAIVLSQKSWSNAISDARAAMVYGGIVRKRISRPGDLTPDWQRLWKIVLASGDPTLPKALRRFVHFLNRQQVAPGDVGPEHAQAYLDAVTVNEISKSPEVAYRAAVNGWNLVIRRISEWPRAALPLESRARIIVLPENRFSETFTAEVDRLIASLANPDPFAEHGRLRPLRQATLKQYRHQLIRFASELVHAGMSPDDIGGLEVLIEPENAERGLREMLRRNDNKTNRSISEMAGLLRNISKTLQAPPENAKAVTRLAARVAVRPQNGMTPKNRSRLRVLQDEKRQLGLLTLPERLYSRAQGKTKPYYLAVAREDALAIAILLVCPVRIKNIAGIHLDRHLHRPGDGRVFLVFRDEDVKNARPIEFELPQDVVRMIDRHLASRSPMLCPNGTPWLFPQRDGGRSIAGDCLSGRLKKRIWTECGLEMNAHLFRHLSVMIWLDANPGGYEVARRLLGHSDLSHTLNMYSGLEANAATKAFADLIGAKKGPLNGKGTRR